MRRVIWLLLVLLIVAQPAMARTKVVSANSNCSNPKAVGWIPISSSNGEVSTLTASWKNGSRQIVAAVACELGGEAFMFAAWAADSRGSLVMQAGTNGVACVAVFCTVSGSAKLWVNLITGTEEGSLMKLSKSRGDRRPIRGRLVAVNAGDWPEAVAFLKKLRAAR